MRRLLAAAAFALLAASAAAQTPIVNIQEVDEDGNQIALTDKSRIVDINSTLNLTIDRAALNNYLEQKGLTGSASDLVARIDTLTAVLQRERRQPPAVAEGVRQHARSQRLGRGAQGALGPDRGGGRRRGAAGPRRAGAQLVPQRAARAGPAGGGEPGRTVPAGLRRRGEHRARPAGPVRHVATTNGVYVQLGAWVETRPIHIAGFDDYPQDEHYVVQRWNLALSEDEQARLTAYSELAKKVNADGWKTLLSWKTVGPSIIQAYLQETKTGSAPPRLANNFDTAKGATWPRRMTCSRSSSRDARTRRTTSTSWKG